MSHSSIDTKIEKILRKNNGWLRTEQCAKKYARDSITGEIDSTKRTVFYRWRKKVEKGQNTRFQIVSFPRNMTFIGLKTANPKLLEALISKDKKLVKKVKIGTEIANTLLYYGTLEEQYGCKAAGNIKRILEDIIAKYGKVQKDTY